MKKVYFFVLAWAFLLQTGSAQTMKAINLEPGDKLINQGVNISIDFTSEKKPWCGLRVDWGNGKSQPVRVGHDGEEGAPTSPIKLSNVYSSAGKYNITVKGELLIRGLTGTAMPCEVKTSATEVVVMDAANEIAAKEKEKQRVLQGEQQKTVELKANEIPNDLPPLGQSSPQEPKKIQTVVADGFGVNFQTAQQDAAQRALTNVVGSFIDAKSSIEQRTEISAGIRDTVEKHTVDIKESIKEYSQGTIQKIEILEVGTEGGLTKVRAKVSVRIDDFRAYIKKIAQGEVAVDQGLFAQATVANKQRVNINQLFLDNILKPLTVGDVVDFQVAAPEPLLNMNYKGGVPEIDGLLKFASPESLFIVRVHASLRPAFIQNMTQTLESIAKARSVVEYQWGGRPCSESMKSGNKDLDFSFFSSDMVIYDDKIKQFISKSRNQVGYLIDGVQLSAKNYLLSTNLPKLKIMILDGSGRSLQEDSIRPNGTVYLGSRYQNPRPQGSDRAFLIRSNILDGFAQPYLFIGSSFNCLWQTTERDFSIALVINAESLKNAKKIVVKMEP